MYHYTYRIHVSNPTDSRRFYVGVRSCKCWPTEDKKYWGSSDAFNDWQKENGTDGLRKEILAIWGTRQLAVEHEIKLHNFLNVVEDESYFNRAKQTSTGFDTTGVEIQRTESWKKNISKALTGIPVSEEQKQKQRAAMKGRKLSEEHRQKTIAALKNRKLSEETKRKIGDANRGRKYSAEILLKMKQIAVLREAKKKEARNAV